MTALNRSKIRLDSARSVLLEEARSIRVMADELVENKDLGKNFIRALHLIEQTQKTGKVIVSGMGKSAHIAKKLATTLSSTGTPSVFIHPGEASHGDLGSITKKDIVIAISNSGESRELFDLYDYCDKFKIPYIGMTRSAKGTLAKRATIPLVMPDIAEVCPIGKAPTTSTIMTAALGDALTVVAAQRVGLTKEIYKNWHPGGKLGGSLVQVKYLLQKSKNPFHVFKPTDSLEKIRSSYLKKRGALFIVEKGQLIGFIDPAALLENRPLSALINPNLATLAEDAPLYEIQSILADKKSFGWVAVLDKKDRLLGVIYAQNLL